MHVTINYSRVKPENITKLRHCMRNALRIDETKYCYTKFLFLRPAYFIRPSKQKYYVRRRNKPIIITSELILNCKSISILTVLASIKFR